MEPFELLKIVAEVCDRLSIRYVTVGSLATIAYGEPRFTNDIDLVIDLKANQLDEFCDAFPPPAYYLSREAARAAIRDRRQFNIIHIAAGLKADCILPATPFDAAQFSRAVRKRVRDDFEALFAAPEDVILKKMEYYLLGGSDKHLRDIAGVLKISAEIVDRSYIATAAERLGLTDIWKAIVSRTDKSELGPRANDTPP
jgi:hypothetical protein